MGFSGFNKNTIIFFVELMMNNEKPWFDANRHRYDADAIEPAKQLVEELGAELQQFRPGIHAIPKVNKSLFRINRDVRFSTNKDPYKTNLAIMFWEGTRKRMECPGLYIHVDTGSFFWGMGLYQANTPLDSKRFRFRL